MLKSVWRVAMVGAVASLVGTVGLHAQGSPGTLSPEQIVAVRKSVMDLQQGVMAEMKAAVDAKSDIKPLVPGAKGLLASSHVIVTLFPVGTEKVGNTKAKPEIWSDPAGWNKAAEAMTEATTKLVTVAESGDKDAFAAQYAAVGKTCGGCHRSFKEKDD